MSQVLEYRDHDRRFHITRDQFQQHEHEKDNGGQAQAEICIRSSSETWLLDVSQ